MTTRILSETCSLPTLLLLLLLSLGFLGVAVAAASERAQLEQLKSWVEERGMDTSHLYFNFDAPIRGLYARTAIAVRSAALSGSSAPAWAVCAFLSRSSSSQLLLLRPFRTC